jgi:hypothetical protein
LSHLNSHSVTYVNEDTNETYRFKVTYSSHCFTIKISDALTTNQDPQLIYNAPTESRLFDFQRYNLSKNLLNIINSLGNETTQTYHAKNGNYATFKVLDDNGSEINYLVPFVAFRDKKKFRLHIVSAYPTLIPDKKYKVKFFTIAKNLLNGKPLPRPHITKTP